MKKSENKGTFSCHIQTVHLIPGKVQSFHRDVTSGGAGLCDSSLVLPVFSLWAKMVGCRLLPSKTASLTGSLKSTSSSHPSNTFQWPLPRIVGLFGPMRSSSGCTFTFDLSWFSCLVSCKSQQQSSGTAFPVGLEPIAHHRGIFPYWFGRFSTFWFSFVE